MITLFRNKQTGEFKKVINIMSINQYEQLKVNDSVCLFIKRVTYGTLNQNLDYNLREYNLCDDNGQILNKSVGCIDEIKRTFPNKLIVNLTEEDNPLLFKQQLEVLK